MSKACSTALPRQVGKQQKEADSALTFSSMKFKQPSLGTNAAIFLPFLMS